MKFVEKILKNLLQKIAKMHYFSIFQKNFNKPCVNFFAFGRKTQIVWKFWEKLLKIFIKKCIILAYFSNQLTNYAFIFCVFGRKTQIVGKFWENFDENSIENLNFLFFFRKFVTKNRAFGNNTIFLQQFFPFRGGDFLLPPSYAIALGCSAGIESVCPKVPYLKTREKWHSAGGSRNKRAP